MVVFSFIHCTCNRAFRLANFEDPNQTSRFEVSDLGLHCLHREDCRILYGLIATSLMDSIIQERECSIPFII